MTYYNENDPKTAAWLRELIKEGHIPAGYVDERSILDVKPHELTAYAQQHFFAGIGGWAFALRLAGWDDSRPVRTGSCPCQPFSQSGKQLGTKDERHLWPVFRDLITFGEATITFGEQVASPLGREWLAGVRTDLEGLGYEVGAADLCSAGVGSPNIRQRLFWVANACGTRRIPGTYARIHRGKEGTRARDGQPERCGAIGRMANADGRQSGNRGIQRGGRHGQQPENETTPVGLANAIFRNVEQRQETVREAESSRRGEAYGMGDANEPGSQGWNERVIGCSYQWPIGTPNLVVLCQDGKARRFKSDPLWMANGLSERMDSLWASCLRQIEKEINIYAKNTENNAEKIMRDVRKHLAPHALQRTAGGFDCLSEEALLFAALCELKGKLGNIEHGEASCSREESETIVRGVREGDIPSCPSQGRKYAQQLGGKLANAVRELPQEITSHFMHGFPLIGKITGRVGLLRGYGNAINPWLAAQFIQASVEAIGGIE